MNVYIAGPITKGPRPKNIHTAVKVGTLVAQTGHLPFIPHLFELWDLIDPQPYEFWMELDFQLIKLCHALIRIPGESSGADREVAYAEELNIPVYYSFESWKCQL